MSNKLIIKQDQPQLIERIKFHIASLLYATFISIGFFIILYFVNNEAYTWCDVNMGDSSATMPCTELNQRVYEVKM